MLMKTKKVILKTLSFAAVTTLAGIVSSTNSVFAEQNIDVTATLNPSASIELISGESFTVAPTGNGTFNHSDFNIKAYTNSLAGYTIIMTADDTNLSQTGIEGATPIPTLDEKEGGYSCLTYAEEAALLRTNSVIPECNFTSNRWGIAVNSGNYFPVFSGMVINRTHEATGSKGDITTVKLGAKIDTLAASGTYEATINFAIVANVTEYATKVNFADSNISSVTFTNGSETKTVSESGKIVDLNVDTEYTVTATFVEGYELDAWTTTGGTIASENANSTTFTITESNYGDIVVSSKEVIVADAK